MSKLVSSAVNGLEMVLSPLQNNKVSVPLVVLLVLYSSLVAPNPPAFLVKVLKNKVVKLAAIFVLALVFAHGDQKLAIMSAVAVIVTLVIADNVERLNKMVMNVGGVLTQAGQGVISQVYDGSSVTVPASVSQVMAGVEKSLPGF